MNRSFYLLAGIFIFGLIAFLIFLSVKDNYLASDSAYYGIISQQIIKDQRIVVEVANMENRAVQYPQLFFVANTIYELILGEHFHKIIIFFVSIFIILLLVKTFNFKKESFNLILLVIFAIVFFSSPFFSQILRYKIETLLFFNAALLLYLFSKRSDNISILLLFSLFVGTSIALKQFGFIFLPFIFILPFLGSAPLKIKFQRLIIGLVLVVLISAPFYMVMKASTGFFTGIPQMRLPYVDNLKIQLPNIGCAKICRESMGLIERSDLLDLGERHGFEEDKFIIPDLLRLRDKQLSMDSLITAFNQLLRGGRIIRFLPGLLLLAMFLYFIFWRFNKNYFRQAVFIISLVIFSLLAYIKIARIWSYWIHASFLFEILIVFIIVLILFNFKNRTLTAISLLLFIIFMLISSFNPAYQNIYLRKDAVSQRVAIGLIEAKEFIPNDFYALSNRGYEPAYYLGKPILISQRYGMDFLIERDGNRDEIYQFFYGKNGPSFAETSQIRGVNHIVFVKNIRNQGLGDIDIRPAFRDSLAYFESINIVEKTYENREVIIYKINLE